MPGFVSHQRGIGRGATPMIHYRGADVREALHGLAKEKGDRYEGITLRLRQSGERRAGVPDPRLLGAAAAAGRGDASQARDREHLLRLIEGSGATEIAGKRFEWGRNDMFVVPNFLWRRHINTGKGDAVLYSVSERR